MTRRRVLLLAASAAIVLLAAMAQKKPDELLLLQWAKKAKLPTPPVAILIEMGLKDTEPFDWSGKATVEGAKVVHREGYRFREDDKLVEPDGWNVKSHRPIRLPRNQPALARTEGIATVGVVLHLADVTPDAKLTLDLPFEPAIKPVISVKELLTGRHIPANPGGNAIVRLISTATPVVTAKTEDDFPAAAYGPDGTLWLAYISYHLKDESRRIEQKPLQEQPANFKDLYKPEFGDQLLVKYLKDGKWSDEIARTLPDEDLMRCAIAVDPDGTAWVAYSANDEGRYELYVRPVGKKFDPKGGVDARPRAGPEQKLLPAEPGAPADPPSRLNPAACTDQQGNIWVAFQTQGRSFVNQSHRMNGIATARLIRGDPWRGHSNWMVGWRNHVSYMWSPTIAGLLDDTVFIATDAHADGDYDVYGQQQSLHRIRFHFQTRTEKFDARPSVASDAKGNIWIAYEEGPEKWGKDFGAFDEADGEPLYAAHSVRVVCLVDGKLLKPVAELPTSNARKPKQINREQPMPGPGYERQSRYTHPKIGIDGKGRIWLTYRQKFGSRYSTHPGSYWLTFARRLDGEKWSEPIELHHSCGLLDHRPVLLPHPAGGLVIIHNTDGRFTTPETIDNQIYMSYVDLPGEPIEPKLSPHELGHNQGNAESRFSFIPPQGAASSLGSKPIEPIDRADREMNTIKKMRDYRVEAGGKQYQLLRGEFHRHTEMSWDGGPDGSLEDMFRYAIDAAQLDWIGNGDHDNGGGREYSWWLTQKLTDAYHVPGVFTPMFTYERSVAFPHGHRNCMFAKRGVRTLPRLAAKPQAAVGGVHADDTKMLYRYLKELDGICASHTSATGMGTDWRDNDPVAEPIVEIYQGDRMSYEYPDCPRAGYDPQSNKLPVQIGGWRPAGFLTTALKEKGYRLGFQASSDHWSTHISYCIVLAEKHDRASILDAMKKRHVYAATDDIILDVKSGAHMMGDEFKTKVAPSLSFKVISTKPIDRIDILRDSEVVETIKPRKQEHAGTWTDPQPKDGVHYYYVRVTQTDGELAWGSPMWIEIVK